MNFLRIFTFCSILCISLFTLSCDDRIPTEEDAVVESGSLVLSQVFVVGTTSNPTIVGEVLSDAGSKSSVVVIARLLDSDGNGVNGKVLQFKSDIEGSFDTDDPSTKYVPNFKEFGYSELGGNGYAYARFTPKDGEEQIETTANSGATITVEYTSDIIDNVEFSVFSQKEQVWPYTMNLTSSSQVDLGASSPFEVLLQNAYGQVLSGVFIDIESANGSIGCGDTCYTNETGRINTTFESYSFSENEGIGSVGVSFYHPTINDTVILSQEILIGPEPSGTVEGTAVFIVGETSNPTIVGEVLSDSDAKSSVVVIARLLDVDGNGVNGKYLQFQSDIEGSFDSIDSLTSFVQNFQEFGLSDDMGGDGYIVSKFTPDDGVEKIETAASSGAFITIKYTDDISDNVEFSVFSQKEQVWPYTMNITANSQVDLGASSPFEVLLQNAHGNELVNVLLDIQSSNGNIECGDTCYTDATGQVNTTFESYSFSENVGPGLVYTSFYHPSINDTVTVSKQIVIGSESAVGSCSYIEIPSSNPSEIVVADGGGIESTDIRAEIYDNNGNLLTSTITVNFRLEPVLSGTYLNVPGQTNVNVETVNGIATVSLNSGSEPGPVRIIATTNTAETSVCDTLNDALESISVPVIIASGAPYYIEAEYDPNSTEAIGGGFYQTECAAIVYDKWYNPVEDSTYVYWNINPLPPDTLIDAFVEGVSYTNNEGVLSGTATPGVARSHIVYSTDAIGDIGQVRALTFGTNGDSVASFINEGQGDATLFFLPGQVTLLSEASYWDFTLDGATAQLQISALVIDFYGNPVVDAPVAFSGTGVDEWYEIQYETAGWVDEGVDGLGAGDGCFTWRDYGLDNDAETLDMGSFNQKHDAFDTDGDGAPDTAEVSEPFEDWGRDGQPDTFDEGEGNGYWDGYSMINCEAVVRTDQDGYARIGVQFTEELCPLANINTTTEYCTYDDFTATLSATLLIPEITTSDPLDILLVRSTEGPPCP